MMIKSLYREKTPFAVMQYFVKFKASKSETRKAYELIYIDLDNPNEDNLRLSYKVLSRPEVSFLMQNLETIPAVIDNEDGKIYEFNNFKEHKEKLIPAKLKVF